MLQSPKISQSSGLAGKADTTTTRKKSMFQPQTPTWALLGSYILFSSLEIHTLFCVQQVAKTKDGRLARGYMITPAADPH